MLSFESTQEETSAVLYNTRYPIVLILNFSIYLFTHNFVLSSGNIVLSFCLSISYTHNVLLHRWLFIPAICVVVQLHHCSTVPLQSGIIFTISVHIPHHCSKETACTTSYSKYLGVWICFNKHFCTIVRCLHNYILNILHMSLSNPEDASVAPLGWNLQQ